MATALGARWKPAHPERATHSKTFVVQGRSKLLAPKLSKSAHPVWV
ncbi:hypothetical protein [Rothia sp. HMSC08A08]|nr:hypothetical protein [Rothia sp. HMSC08A08]